MNRPTTMLRCYLATLALCAMQLSCSKEKPETADKKKPEPVEQIKEGVTAVAEDASASTDVLAKLARADEVDGNLDKVVSKCPSCALRMDGKPEYSLTFSGFTLQFCSKDCKKGFESDTAKKILALKIEDK